MAAGDADLAIKLQEAWVRGVPVHPVIMPGKESLRPRAVEAVGASPREDENGDPL